MVCAESEVFRFDHLWPSPKNLASFVPHATRHPALKLGNYLAEGQEPQVRTNFCPIVFAVWGQVQRQLALLIGPVYRSRHLAKQSQKLTQPTKRRGVRIRHTLLSRSNFRLYPPFPILPSLTTMGIIANFPFPSRLILMT